MGKVKDGAPATKATKAVPKGGSSGGSSSRRRFVQFLANLFRGDLYKPMQGRHARIYTAIALGVVVALGLWRLFETLTDTREAQFAARLLSGFTNAETAVLTRLLSRIADNMGGDEQA